MSTPQLSRILLVEDDPDIQAVACMALETVGGFEVKMCNCGADALENVREFAPDLILLDVMMPGLDGPTTLEELRRLDEIAMTPVVFMTAKVQAAEKSHYCELGAVDVIAKPFDPMSLAATVQGIWDRCHTKDAQVQ